MTSGNVVLRANNTPATTKLTFTGRWGPHGAHCKCCKIGTSPEHSWHTRLMSHRASNRATLLSRWRGSLLAHMRAPTLATPAPIGESSGARLPACDAPFVAIMHTTSDSTGRRSGFGSVIRVASWSKESKCSVHMPLSSCGNETMMIHVHHTHHDTAVCHHARS